MPQEAEVSASPTAAWSIACAALCASIIAFGVLGFKDGSGGMVYQIGASLPFSVMLAGALHFAFRRRVATSVGWLGFALIFASLVTASGFAVSRQKAEMRRVGAGAVQTLEKLKKAVAAGDTLAPLPVASDGEGEAGKMMTIMNTMINRALALRQEYDTELNRVGWPAILDWKRIAKDKNFNESRAILQKAWKIVDTYEKKNAQVYLQIREDIQNSALDAGSKQSMLRGFDKSVTQGKAKAARLWALERESVTQVDNMIKLLDASRGKWHVDQDTLSFDRQADLDQFNVYVAQSQAITKKQAELQTNALQKAQDQMEKIGR